MQFLAWMAVRVTAVAADGRRTWSDDHKKRIDPLTPSLQQVVRSTLALSDPYEEPKLENPRCGSKGCCTAKVQVSGSTTAAYEARSFGRFSCARK